MKAPTVSNNEVIASAGRERLVIAALCIAAACRIFFFNAAFPLFNNVDEEAHFDLVYKYSRGDFPRAAAEKFSGEAAEMIVLYGSPEYLSTPQEFGSTFFAPPPWTDPEVRQSADFNRAVSAWQERDNHETCSFPVYYMLAGLWCAAGRVVGMEGGRLLYWIRFLNVPLFVGLVLFSYLITARLFPHRGIQRIGLPLLVAFFPQDIFYAITNDAVTPLLFGASFLLLLGVYSEDRSHVYHLLTGVVVAATFLAKITNITVLGLLGAIVVFKAMAVLTAKRGERLAGLGRLGTLLAAAAVPICIWLVRNHVVLGSCTGAAEVIRFRGWTAKPFSAMWGHPIFSFKGLAFFLTELTRTFWRGEFVWHRERIASAGSDAFYIASTGLFVLACAAGLVGGSGKANKPVRFVLAASLCMVFVSVLLLAVLSVRYDFGDCPYPSRQRPFLVSGRLISGVLPAFLLVYLDGFERIFSKLKTRLRPLAIVALVAAAITISEFALSWDVFTSQYNWFSLN